MAVNRVKITNDIELKDRLVAINRVTKVTKGGRTFTFAAIVVVGNENGVIGWGLGKAGEVTAAIAKGVEAAKKNMRAYMETGVSDSYDLFQIAQEELGNGNYAMALECLTTALEMDKVPNKQIIMKNLVMIYEKLSDFETAKAVLKEYVKEYPDDEEAKRELTFLETRIREEETQGN